MPKVPTQLYNHNARNTTARQLNLSTNPSGRTSYSYTSSHVQLDPVEPEAHGEVYAVDLSMDIDDDHEVNIPSMTEQEATRVFEVVPGLRVVSKLKAKRYDNSVSPMFHLFAIANLFSAGCSSGDLGQLSR
jgi:hypothetical protein